MLRSTRRDDGFTLIEVMVAATLLVVGVLGVLTLLDGANNASARSKAREGATNLAREAIEAARAVPYPELTPTRIEDEIEAQPGLEDDSTDAGWNVRRRGIVYTLVPNVCSVDDGTVASDGFGNHAGGSYCPDSTTTGTADNNPEDYKRVWIDVTWKSGSKTFSARQQGVINNPGSAFAPAVRTLQANPAGPTITNALLASVTFTATTSSRAEDFQWSLDGVTQGSATPTNSSRTAWSFTWLTPSSVVDGTYEIGATAYDQFGQSGTSRTLTLQLNRAQPVAPTGFTGGYNPLWPTTGDGRFAEFEWNPNAERDILGYRVKRMAGPVPSVTDPVVTDCERTVEQSTSCTTHVDSSLAVDQHFYVVAYAPARNSSGVEESPLPTLPGTKYVGAASPPGAPQNVTGVVTADGTTLSWTAPADTDVRYYRIYRDDNTSFTKRVDRTGTGSDTAITDPNATATGHTYWLTAVDNDLAESEMAPPGGISP
jgi:prepilin-type N-terminal cleavage/methylation domain-containing protein